MTTSVRFARFQPRTLLLAILALLLAAPRSGEAEPPSRGRGVILFVGDGMGVASITAARIHQGALEGREMPVSATLTLDRAPRGALVRTYSSDRMVTDSAAAITAMTCGRKVPNGWLGVAPTPDGGLDTLQTLAELALERGWATGVVTTTTLVHATPAGMTAHTPDRGAYESIAASLVPKPGARGMDVILGGGWRYFLPDGSFPEGLPPDGSGASRTEGRDLLAEMARAGYTVVRTTGELRAAATGETDLLLGVFSRGHLDYEHDRDQGPDGQPSLAEMTRVALERLSRDPQGYFLLVEGGRIDHALHECNGYRAITDLLALDAAVRVALEFADPQTLILVTADHDHSMVIAGYPPATDDVLGIAGEDRNGDPYTTLLFANGDGSRHQPEGRLTPEMAADPDYRQKSGIPLDGDAHGGMDVPLFAWGPRGILDRIGAVIENTGIHTLLEGAILGR